MLLTELKFVPSPLLTQWKHHKAFPSTCWHLVKYHDSKIVLCFQKTHQLQTKKQGSWDTRSFTLAGLRSIQRAKTTHSTSQGSLRHLLSLLKGCWCQFEQPNVFIQPSTWHQNQGLWDAKERSQKMARSCLPLQGKTPSLGPFHAALVPREQGRAKRAAQRGAQLQTGRLKDQIWMGGHRL